MAVVYLRSTDGNDADSGATWALAKATLASALTAAGAGGTVYVSQAHAETRASVMMLTSPGTAASPVLVICVNDGAEPPTALATTATVSVTGAYTITMSGVTWCYGITFNCGTGANSVTIGWASWSFESCNLNVLATGTVTLRCLSGRSRLVNTSCTLSSDGQNQFTSFGDLWWIGGTANLGGTATNWFGQSNTTTGIMTLIGVDLSQISTLQTCVNSGKRILRLINCKLKAGVTPQSGLTTSQAEELLMVNCDSADTNSRFHLQNYFGTITSEPVIVKTGGSSDGTTPFSRKFVSTANSKIYSPLEGLWTTFWNETVGSAITVAADVVTDGVTLTDAEAWIEVEYLGNGSFPISTTTTDRVSDIIFGTPANQTTSSAAWTTTGLASPTKQTLSVSITPQEKGPIRARVCLAKASTTMYVDQVVMSGTSGRQYMIGAEGIINEGAGGGGVANLLGGIIQ